MTVPKAREIITMTCNDSPYFTLNEELRDLLLTFYGQIVYTLRMGKIIQIQIQKCSLDRKIIQPE